MPSFDVVSEIDKHELTNAIDQANRELTNRFDFRGTNARFELDDLVVSMSAPSEFQLQQMMDILRQRLTARAIDVGRLVCAPANRGPLPRPWQRREQSGRCTPESDGQTGYRTGTGQEDRRPIEGRQVEGRSANQWRQASRQRQEAR